MVIALGLMEKKGIELLNKIYFTLVQDIDLMYLIHLQRWNIMFLKIMKSFIVDVFKGCI